MEEIVIRDLIIADDTAFIIDSWLKSYYGKSTFSCHISKKVFFEEHKKIVIKLLKKSTIKVAVDGEDSSNIAGYIVYEPNKIHYIYIKEVFRGFGICKKLLCENNFFDRTEITHLTLRARKIQLKMGFIYCPYFD